MNLMFRLALLPFASAALMAPVLVQAAPKPALSKAQAEAIALKTAPGKIVESDYEKEKGAWRWSFDIKQGRRIHEIGVDAMSGKIVESSYETAGNKD